MISAAPPLPDSIEATPDLSQLETEVIRMSNSRLIVTMFYLYSLCPIVILVILAVAAITAGIVYDIRWAIVFLLVVFIVTPLLMTFLYFYHGLRSSTASNVTPHTLLFSHEGITVKILEVDDKPLDPDDNTPDAEEQPCSTDENKPRHSSPKHYSLRHKLFFPYAGIDRYRAGRDGFIITLREPEKGFLWLPYDSFGNLETLQYALGFLSPIKKVTP